MAKQQAAVTGDGTPVNSPKRKQSATPTDSSASKRRRAASSTGSTPKGTPSAVKQKRVNIHHGRKTRANEKELAPGDVSDTKTFVKLAKKEGEVGAYMRYSRREEFRRFAMSAYVLEAYISTFSAPVKQIRQEDVLGYIRDQPEEMKSDEDPCIKYPVQTVDDIHVMQRMALAICQLYRRNQKTVSEGVRPSQEEQDGLSARFKQLTKKTPPDVQIDQVILNDLGPYSSHGEGELEAYNRCFNIIMYVSFSLNNSTWGQRFGSKKWADPTEFSSQVVPHWMRQREGTSKSATAPDQDSSSSEAGKTKPTCQVDVVWKSTAKTPRQTELMKHLNDEDMAYDLVLKSKIEVRATATAAEVRDLIRAKFKMSELGAQIMTLQAVPSMTNIMEEEWSTVQEELWSNEGTETSFVMTLRRQETAEDIWENQEVPGLSKMILSTDGEDLF